MVSWFLELNIWNLKTYKEVCTRKLPPHLCHQCFSDHQIPFQKPSSKAEGWVQRSMNGLRLPRLMRYLSENALELRDNRIVASWRVTCRTFHGDLWLGRTLKTIRIMLNTKKCETWETYNTNVSAQLCCLDWPKDSRISEVTSFYWEVWMKLWQSCKCLSSFLQKVLCQLVVFVGWLSLFSKVKAHTVSWLRVDEE